MRQTDDIAPLIDLAEDTFNRLHGDALAAVNHLERFWERLYGPSEALTDAKEQIGALWDAFYEEVET